MRLALAVAVVLTACGDDAGSAKSDGGGGGSGIDLDTRIRACATIGACVGYALSECMILLDRVATADQIACINTATAADCNAVRACVGVRFSTDACTPGCLDADTVVRCSGGTRAEYDCADVLEDVGPMCVTNGRTDCGGGTCSVDGERTCVGNVLTICDSGITEVTDCAAYGGECVATPTVHCAGPASGSCTAGTAASCAGDTLVICDGTTERRYDCKDLGGRTCVVRSGVPTCGFGTECNPMDDDTCTGTTLSACVDGIAQTIDCTSIGATMCRSSPGDDSTCR